MGGCEGVRVCSSCCSVYSKFICESFLCEFCGLRCDAQNFRVNVPIHKDLFLAIITILIQVTNVLSTRILIQ